MGSPQTFVLVCLAVGMTLGALIVPQVERSMRLQLLFVGSVATFGVAMLGFASVRQYWIACLFTALAGALHRDAHGRRQQLRRAHDRRRDPRARVHRARVRHPRVDAALDGRHGAARRHRGQGDPQTSSPRSGVPYDDVYLTGPRITLWVASMIVIGAAIYAFRTLNWRQAEECAARPRGGRR